MSRMHNPPHPGAIIVEYRGETTQTDAADALGISRQMLNRIEEGRSRVTADVARRLALAFDTSAEFWMGLQVARDLWDIDQVPQPKVRSLVRKDKAA